MILGIIGITLYLFILASHPGPTLTVTAIVIAGWFLHHWIMSYVEIRRQRRW